MGAVVWGTIMVISTVLIFIMSGEVVLGASVLGAAMLRAIVLGAVVSRYVVVVSIVSGVIGRGLRCWGLL